MGKWLGPWQFLFFAFVAIGLGVLAWWPFEVVHVTTTGIKWTDLMAAIGTPVIVILSAFFALMQLRESEKSRYAALAADLTRRWDEDVVANSRRFGSLHTADDVLRIIEANYAAGTSDDDIEAFYKLQALPNFIEGIAAIEDEFGGLSIPLTDRLWGGVIIRTWDRWSPAVDVVRKQPGYEQAFKNFESLAIELRDRRAANR